ncbi:transposase [Streptomyces sp. NPDC057424]|uniref:transposase n=1 Tax=Streptomyces sp. NPDC057424 TaxID=3346127 RepID=UPI0036B99570
MTWPTPCRPAGAEVHAAWGEEGPAGSPQRRGCDHAEKAVREFAGTYEAKWPKAVKKITDKTEELLAFYDFPAQHWIHLRTTIQSNPLSVR